VKVIITFGGNVSALAAARNAKKPFLSVFGNLTAEFTSGESTKEYCRGGINLDTVARTAERFYRLNQKLRIPASEICLLTNPFSAIGSAEEEQWRGIPQAGAIHRAADDNALRNAFAAFTADGSLSTMIVSADASFQMKKELLITLANGTGKRVCYPLHTYANVGGTTRPAPGRHWLHGPKLAKACFQLGRDAAMVLKDDKEKFPLRVPPMLLDANDDEI
jgi:hypothetical protein